MMIFSLALVLIPVVVILAGGIVILRDRRSRESPVVWAIGVVVLTVGVAIGSFALISLLMNLGVYF